jgi:methyltransferase family protein
MSWSVRRIGKIKEMNGAQSYLEIGVYSGQTFLNVDLARKDAVDPKFRFNVDDYKSETVRFFQMTSDEFWTTAPALAHYDIIMIDGLHTFEQAFRDFVCSLSHSHERTVWLIDDTVPSDVFSAYPDQARSYAERQRMGLQDFPWHGDVFKLVLALHDFFPTVNYATILNSGNPQTLAWYGQRTGFAPVLNNLEAISRLAFFDLEGLQRAFNFAEEEPAFERLAEAGRGAGWTRSP